MSRNHKFRKKKQNNFALKFLKQSFKSKTASNKNSVTTSVNLKKNDLSLNRGMNVKGNPELPDNNYPLKLAT